MCNTRITFIAGICLSAGCLSRAASAPRRVQVAYAGSMTAGIERGLAPVALRQLQLKIEGRAQGAYGLAHLILSGAIRPDIFISITPGPMRLVLHAGMAHAAWPMARTQLVLAYAPSSRYRGLFTRAARPGGPAWWQILTTPGLRLGRTNPQTDPQGRNFLLVLRAAARRLHQPGLAHRIAGAALNPRQIFPEAEVMARLQAGQLDAASAYQIQPVALGLPFLPLPWPYNLGPGSRRALAATPLHLLEHAYTPDRLIFYAAVLLHAPHPHRARRLLHWFQAPAAQAILRRFGYAPAGRASRLQ